MREQRAPATSKGKPLTKVGMEDQEQQDPMDFLPSDEAEEEEPEEGKSSNGGGAARRRLQEQRERLHGALALIELANNLSAWIHQCKLKSRVAHWVISPVRQSIVSEIS